MTDRLKGCWVAFEQDYRVDDAESILAAIRQVRGVAGVEPKVSNYEDWSARQQVRESLRDLILEFFERLRTVK